MSVFDRNNHEKETRSNVCFYLNRHNEIDELN